MNRSIAVIDDDPSLRKGLSRLLRSAGFSVSTFASGEDFLGAADPALFDCLVIDVHLGGITGFELLRRLDPARGFGVVIITAHDEAAIHEALQAAGSPPCLSKPFDPEELLAAIFRTLDRPEV